MPTRLVLVGMMGSGKSAVGQLAARRMGWRFVDTDEAVVAEAGRTVAELFDDRGEAGFRALESEVLARSLQSQDDTVVAAGGGAVLDAGNRSRLSEVGTVVWLRARPDTLARRVGSGAGRPLLELAASDGPAALEAELSRLSQARAPMYEEVADLVVDVDDLEPAQVADRLCAVAAEAQA